MFTVNEIKISVQNTIEQWYRFISREKLCRKCRHIKQINTRKEGSACIGIKDAFKDIGYIHWNAGSILIKHFGSTHLNRPNCLGDGPIQFINWPSTRNRLTYAHTNTHALIQTKRISMPCCWINLFALLICFLFEKLSYIIRQILLDKIAICVIYILAVSGTVCGNLPYGWTASWLSIRISNFEISWAHVWYFIRK